MMEAYRTNNNPKVIPDYFITSLACLDECPDKLQTDRGMEIGHIKKLVCLFGLGLSKVLIRAHEGKVNRTRRR